MRVKCKGYINIYRDKDTSIPYTDGYVRLFKGPSAEAKGSKEYVTTIRITWEEEI